MCSVREVAIIGSMLCSLGNLIFSVRSGMVLGEKSPSQTECTGTFLLLYVSPGFVRGRSGSTQSESIFLKLN